MKVISVSSIDLEGKPASLSCTECQDQARIEYNISGVRFSLCFLCVMKLEKLTSNVLSSLLEMRVH